MFDQLLLFSNLEKDIKPVHWKIFIGNRRKTQENRFAAHKTRISNGESEEVAITGFL